MRISLKQDVRTIRAIFPKGNWETVYIDLLGVPITFCREGVDEIEFDLRPFPYDEMPVNRGMFSPVELQKKEFLYCIVGWRGDICGEDGSVLPCDDKTKLAVFNHYSDIRAFVLRCIDEMESSYGHAIKN